MNSIPHLSNVTPVHQHRDITEPIPSEPADGFVRARFGNETEGYICFGFLQGKGMSHRFRPVEDAREAAFDLPEGKNCYLGIAVFKSNESREEANILHVPCLYSEEDATPLPDTLPEPSWRVETSTGRFQSYWQLDKPTDKDTAKKYIKAIADHIGIKHEAIDAARLLRLPGTINHKPGREGFTVRLASETGAVYTLPDFDGLPPKPKRPDAVLLVRRALERAKTAGRNKAGFDLVCQLRDSGYSEDEALAIGITQYVPHVPSTTAEGEVAPYVQSEWEASVRSTYKKPAREPARAPHEDAQVTRAKVTLLSDVKAEKVEWLWDRYLPLGKVSIADGDPGVGKSTMFMDIAARITRGAAMPDGGKNGLLAPAGVVILSAEDGEADTIRPRFDAVGGDAARVVLLQAVTEGGKERSVTLLDIDAIAEAIAMVGAKLVIIDPLMAYLDSRINSHRDQDMRSVLKPLKELAERTGAAIVCIRHFNKTQSENTLYRGGGSIGIIGAARLGMVIARDPDDEERIILAVQKSNVGKIPPAMSYRLAQADNGVAFAAWEGQVNMTAADLLAPKSTGEKGSVKDEAKNVLTQILKDGPMPSDEVKKAAKEAGISYPSLRRAQEEMGIVAQRKGGMGNAGFWTWQLPPNLKIRGQEYGYDSGD